MNILINFISNQRFEVQLNFIKNLNKNSNIKIFIFISDKIKKENVIKLFKSDFKILNYEDNKIKHNLKKILLITKLLSIIKLIFFNLSLVQLIYEYMHLRKLNKFYLYSKKIIIENNIDLIFSNSDRSAELENSILKAARELEIPIIVPYLTLLAEYSVLIKSKKQNKINSLYNIFLSFKFKKYQIQKKDFYPFFIMNALYKFGTLSKNPWIMGNGYSDIICCNNTYTYQQFINDGVDEKKLIVTGDVSYDEIFLNLKNKNKNKNSFYKKNNIDFHKKNILVALPQLAEDGIMPWNQHWEEVNFICNSLDKLNANILISLHPKMNIDKYKFLEGKFNLKIIKQNLSTSIPYADLFIATYSSTILWSILCKINTIVIDFYNLDRSFYNSLKSPRLFKKKSEYISFIENQPFKKKFFDEDLNLLSFQKTFDGNVINRYIDLIFKITNEKNIHNSRDRQFT